MIYQKNTNYRRNSGRHFANYLQNSHVAKLYFATLLEKSLVSKLHFGRYLENRHVAKSII